MLFCEVRCEKKAEEDTKHRVIACGNNVLLEGTVQ